MKPISKKIYLVWFNVVNESDLACLFLTRKAAVNYISSSKFPHLYTIEERIAFNF